MAVVAEEWLIDAGGCDPSALKDVRLIEALLDEVVRELDLRVIGRLVHGFPSPGGVTAMFLLAESHLTCHTYPELGVASFNLACCRPRAAWPWEARLAQRLGAAQVTVRRLERAGGEPGGLP